MEYADLGRSRAIPAEGHALEHPIGGRAVVRVDEVGCGAAEQIVGRVPEDALDGGADETDRSVQIDDRNDVVGVLDQPAEVFLADPERLVTCRAFPLECGVEACLVAADQEDGGQEYRAVEEEAPRPGRREVGR